MRREDCHPSEASSELVVFGQLRGEPETAHVPIIALTGYGKEHLEAALAAGATQAREKPFDFEELVAQVRSLLEQP